MGNSESGIAYVNNFTLRVSSSRRVTKDRSGDFIEVAKAMVVHGKDSRDRVLWLH